ncbi:hypothetical protein GPECTOR_39g410 [Gonium pectorale]|uniref:Uncharacterized protein n=1 Tax=Gonium pectorale TaxID=33097 RepID=A0A150GAN9_GONPE|nr:hypothetical protein GPECTOR_39g410 [Gonium pectorale]|eukprot:KXZ46916.1 hypothetical protein GPECTOR_39g410 [Gonium pectorale]
MVASDVPAVGPGLAETLLWDGERLHAAQNSFQQLAVVTAGLLLVTQMRAASASAAAGGAAAAAGWGPEARSAATRRLLAVVADPGMRLPHLTAELAALAGVAGDEEAEARLRRVFVGLMDPSSAAFRSISNALGAALVVHMTLGTTAAPGSGTAPTHGSAAGPGSSAGRSVGTSSGTTTGSGGGVAGAAAAALLGRVGASGLAPDVAALGGRLLALCAVNEAVHGELYERLYDELVQAECSASPRQGTPAPEAATSPHDRLVAAAAGDGEERLEEGDEI